MKKADYGLDAPGVILGSIAAGVALIICAAAWKPLVLIGGVLTLLGIATWFSSRRGKLLVRDHVLEGLRLLGDERVLDVGCGRGLLLVGAAKRLSRGKAVGVDIWSGADQLDNRRDATLANAAAEGVAAKVDVVDGDMRDMPFEADAFDVVVSNLAIHNVAAASDRQKSIREIARVLKPGGRLALIDLAFTADYARWLRECGLVEVRREWPARWFFPPLGIVTAQKPSSQGAGG
jgi:ubiquinone/menaquinone biosynthesis C-methylase UbiE